LVREDETMADQKRPEQPILEDGIAGGPGPAPPGFDDGTGVPRTDIPPIERLPATEVQREEGEAAERSAGTRGADVPGVRGGNEPPRE
jgi:hypothetical protein